MLSVVEMFVAAAAENTRRRINVKDVLYSCLAGTNPRWIQQACFPRTGFTALLVTPPIVL
jgi:hypothetical protein